MKGSKKRTDPPEDLDGPSEERIGKKPKTSPLKGQRQKASNASPPSAAPSNDAAQRTNAETSETPQIKSVESSSGQPADNLKSESSKVAHKVETPEAGTSKGKAKKQPKDYKIRKLAPRRPFPTVPTSVSATGPRSAHTEGKNYICVTRRTQLGAYLRRCKELVLKDGYKSIHLHAMGAAITHLARLAVSLPTVLPYAKDEIHTEIRTGTAEVHDEIIPNDEDEDISLRKRDKSTLAVIIKIGDGIDEVTERRKGTRGGKSAQKGGGRSEVKKISDESSCKPEQVIFQEGDQDDEEMAT